MSTAATADGTSKKRKAAKPEIELPVQLTYKDDSEIMSNGHRLETFIENYGDQLAETAGVSSEVCSMLFRFRLLKMRCTLAGYFHRPYG